METSVNNKHKAFTSLEQSKKLAKILPLESADMHYHYDNDFDELESIPTITEEDDHFVLFPKDVRCWSLAALLSVIPEVSLNTFKDGKWNAMIQHDGKMIYEDKDNPVDACYEMILKLHELKML